MLLCRRPLRLAVFGRLAALALVMGILQPARAVTAAAQPELPAQVKASLHHFKYDLPKTIRADHPAILPVAAAIRAVTTDPLEQLVMVNDVTHLLVDYDDDMRVYGYEDYQATLDEMIAKRRQEGWLYLRDDCDGRAVFAAHLLASLGIPWRLEASYWKRHAWVVATVNGTEYDLLDFRPNAPELKRVSYRLIGQWFVHPSRTPPPFAWHRAWAERTDRNLTIGLRLGLLTYDSTPDHLTERHATDWTQEAPDYRVSPPDARVLFATQAGFPYGEPLRVSSLASTPVPAPPSSLPGVTDTTAARTTPAPGMLTGATHSLPTTRTGGADDDH